MLKFIGFGNSSADVNTCAYFIKDNNLFIFDCGENIFNKIKNLEIFNEIKNIYILLTHLHSDHCGSLGSFIFFLAKKGLSNNNIFVFFPEKSKIKYLLKIFDVNNLCKILSNKKLKNFYITFYKQKHNKIFSYGYLFKQNMEYIYFSGDTQEIPNKILNLFLKRKINHMYIDTCFDENNKFHIYYKNLINLIPKPLRKNITCIHLSPNYDKNLIADFNIPN